MCAEILVQFLFALGVVVLPEYVERLSVLTCDMLQDLPNGMEIDRIIGIPNVTMSAQYRYSPIQEYYVAPS